MEKDVWTLFPLVAFLLNLHQNFCFMRVLQQTDIFSWNTFQQKRIFGLKVFHNSIIFLGWELLVWYEQDGVWCLHAGLHPEHPEHHPRLRHQHQEPQEIGSVVWCGSSGKLFSGWIWNGKNSALNALLFLCKWYHLEALVKSLQSQLCYNFFLQTLERHFTSYIITYYLPSGLFVVVSWISFLIPPDIVPGRMALLITLFLVLVNIFNNINSNSPKAEGLTAIEIWMLACILFVFGELHQIRLCG